jgi:hypothetical protein
MKRSASKPRQRKVGLLARLRIDRILQQTPCLCGNTETWHKDCYAGKSSDEIERAQDRVYARIQRDLRAIRRNTAAAEIRRIANG